MHVYNRISGSSGEFPFGNSEKEQFLKRLKKLNEFYVIDVLASIVVGNHYHALIHIPAEKPSNKEAAARYFRYYEGKRKINPDAPECDLLAAKLRDVSEFIRELQQPFTRLVATHLILTRLVGRASPVFRGARASHAPSPKTQAHRNTGESSLRDGLEQSESNDRSEWQPRPTQNT